MDSVGIESCSSSRSSLSSPSFNLICETNGNRSDAMDSSNSSEASTSPNQINVESRNCQQRAIRDGSKDEAYWEKRKRNNDAAKRSREKRRVNDMIMEQKLIELTKENSLLRSRLDKQNNIEQKQFHPCKNQEIPLHAPHDSVIIARPNFENTANLGHNSFHTFPTTVGPPPNLTTLFPSTIFPTSSNFLNPTPTNNPTTTQMFQICHLQATLAQQYRNQPSSTISIGCGAFQPFYSIREMASVATVSNLTQRNSPDSSINDVNCKYSKNESNDNAEQLDRQTAIVQRQWNGISPISSNAIDPDSKPQSLLGSLLASRRTSPLVQQSQTDVQSGLNSSPPRVNDVRNCLNSLAVNLICTKSDTESMGSPSSNNNSTSDSMNSRSSPSAPLPPNLSNSAIVEALNSAQPNKQYIDRRRRNNEAAKRCRANRRAQFEYRSKRAQQLEQENDELRKEMIRLKHELEQLKAMHAAKNAILRQH